MILSVMSYSLVWSITTLFDEGGQSTRVVCTLSTASRHKAVSILLQPHFLFVEASVGDLYQPIHFLMLYAIGP